MKKKILCGILCASAGVALAVESPVTTIDVIAVSSDLTNIVIAIPGQDLAGGNLAISNRVKTVNLENGDKLFAFNDGTYQAWVLSDGKWVEVASAGQDSDGKVAVAAGTPAADKKMLVGEGIWLHRSNPSSLKPFCVYGAHASASITVAASATVLLGNPTQTAASPTVSNPQNKDKIIVPTAGFPTYYNYNSETGKWQYIDAEGDVAVSDTPPSITAGTGFWYQASDTIGTRTITW